MEMDGRHAMQWGINLAACMLAVTAMPLIVNAMVNAISTHARSISLWPMHKEGSTMMTISLTVGEKIRQLISGGAGHDWPAGVRQRPWVPWLPVWNVVGVKDGR